MRSRTYVHLSYPWRAAIGRDSSSPAAFYLYLLMHAHRNRLPAARSPRFLHKLMARRNFDLRSFGRVLRSLRATPRPDLDQLLRQVEMGWKDLIERGDRSGLSLPDQPSDLSVLALNRRSATTLFLFVDAPSPILVLKLPKRGHPGVAREIEALERAAPLGVAPRSLGFIGNAAVQEGLPGSILSLTHTPEPASFREPSAHHDLARRLRDLASATVIDRIPAEISPPLDDVIGSGLLPPSVASRVDAAWRALASIDTAVLKHTDISPMNCVVSEGAVGLVDWEMSTTEGTPTFDALNAGLSYFEHCLALSRWSPDELVEAFARSWTSSPHFRFWREDASATCRDLDLPDSSAFEVLFFARRVGHRLVRPDQYPYGPITAARMLESVCASS